MKKIIALLAIKMLFASLLYSQELKVKSFAQDTYNLSARTQSRLDGNGTQCALIKVQTPLTTMGFEGNVIGNVQYKNGEYWVFVSPGTKQLLLKHRSINPQMIYFAENGYNSLKSGAVYVLTFENDNIDDSESLIVSSDGFISKGKECELRKNWYQAFEWFQLAANQGAAEAQYKLGEYYEHGVNDWTDLKAAFEWYTKAADQGYVAAIYNLGNFYEKGIATRKNKKKAFELYHRAATAGNGEAQYSLGLCYLTGEGTEYDPCTAQEWFQASADNGNPNGQFLLGMSWLTGACGIYDKNKAFSSFKQAAEQGLDTAQYCLGECYEKGRGTNIDVEMAIEWYRKAAMQGNNSAIEALNRLGF